MKSGQKKVTEASGKVTPFGVALQRRCQALKERVTVLERLLVDLTVENQILKSGRLDLERRIAGQRKDLARRQKDDENRKNPPPTLTGINLVDPR